MKMKSEHYNFISEAFDDLSVKIGGNNPLATMKQQYKQEGLSDKRFRWDLMYFAKLSPWVCNTLYPYLNDNHIDTALRKITDNY